NKFDKSLSLENPRAFYCAEHNNIGYYNKNEIRLIEDNIREGDIPTNIFDKIFKQIKNDIRFDLFPRFLESDFYKNYIRYKSLESQSIGSRDFTRLTAIGYGAYGIVSVAHKRDSGKAYAIKCFNKKQVVANDEARSVLEEKKLLAMMDSRFVTSLRYSYCDKDDICLVLDLMPCGDLKQLLTRHSTFSEELSRFYAAEILLGLEHIHSRGIIYRDIKLENILLDELGHIKISDFGLSVRKKEMKSYAGTPGYTAPEVVRGEYYKKTADFFSFGVIIYRFMSGMVLA
ncbi:Beta-adrenergic receptor kinase 2, partial [Bonamia ostreae]